MFRDVNIRRGVIAVAISTAAIVAALAGSTSAMRVTDPQAHATAQCHGAGARAAHASGRMLRGALLCLVNRERAARGLRPLRRDRRLRRAATGHARDMARRRYFAHQRAGGPDLGTRLRRAGWRGRAAGETIAYGCGSAGTPRTAVRMWIASPSHAAILFDGSYRRGGPGVAKRPPVRCGGGATWVLDVGRR